MKLDWSRLDGARAKARAALDKLPGTAGDLARKANEALGRPLADEGELEERRAFASRNGVTVVTGSKATATAMTGEAAPVIVYHMDKTRRDALKITELLEGAGVPYKLSNIQEDPAAQMAVRRDSKEYRLPVVFIAGDAVGGRTEITNLLTTGELKKRVFGS